MSPMNNRLLVPRKTPGLLDLVPGAAAAYSLRSLSNSYADPVVTVRRSSDDAEDSFTASEVADGTLAAFCGAGDGFVKTWWDQSGNARHASQATTANQAKVVDGGSLVTDEGLPALEFDGSNDLFVTSDNMPSLTNMLVVVVCSGGSSAINLERGFLSQGTGLSNSFQTGYWLERSTYGGSVATYILNDSLASAADVLPNSGFPQSIVIQQRVINVESAVFLNAVKVASETASSNQRDATIPANKLYIGKTSVTHLGKMQEVIVYDSDVSSQRELLEAQIAWSYSQ